MRDGWVFFLIVLQVFMAVVLVSHVNQLMCIQTCRIFTYMIASLSDFFSAGKKYTFMQPWHWLVHFYVNKCKSNVWKTKLLFTVMYYQYKNYLWVVSSDTFFNLLSGLQIQTKLYMNQVNMFLTLSFRYIGISTLYFQ